MGTISQLFSELQSHGDTHEISSHVHPQEWSDGLPTSGSCLPGIRPDLAESVSDLCDLELFAPHATLFTMKWMGLRMGFIMGDTANHDIMGYVYIYVHIYTI